MGVYGERALQLQKEGFSCAQSVVASLSEKYGVDRMTALRFAGLFGSGIGRSTETCGIITGACMLMGLKYARLFPDETSDIDRFIPAQEFIKWFKEQHNGCFKCRDLLGHDISSDEELDYVLDHQLFESICQKMVYASVDKIYEVIEEFDKRIEQEKKPKEQAAE